MADVATRPQPATPTPATTGAATPAWLVVLSRELRDLWVSGRGLTLMLAFAVLLSLVVYLVASNQELNFLEQREAVSLMLQVAVAVGGLLVVLVAADAVSGERERATLESLLLTPVARRALVIGKGLSALSVWVVAFVLTIPYVWWLGRDVGTFVTAIAGGAIVGSLLALFLTGLGLLVSTFSGSNATSLSISFFVLLAAYAPTQMPAGAQRGSVGELLMRLDPIAAGLTYLDRVIIQGHSLTQDAGLLLFPAVAGALLPVLSVLFAGRLRLLPRSGS